MTSTPSLLTITTETAKVLTSGDAAYWPDSVNIGIPIVIICVFVFTVIFSFKWRNQKPHIRSPLPVIVTKNDATHHDVINSATSLGQKSDGSEGSDTTKKAEAQDTVGESMFQKAKEQALKSRAAKRLNSIRSRLSSSSQYDYSPLDGTETLLENSAQGPESSEDESQAEEAEASGGNVVTVNVEHHSPPRNVVLIHSEDSGFTESSNQSSRTSSSDINLV